MKNRYGARPVRGRGGGFESQAVPSDDRRQRGYTEHLNAYYGEVMSCICDADAILLMGPGEAKGELQSHLKREKLASRAGKRLTR